MLRGGEIDRVPIVLSSLVSMDSHAMSEERVYHDQLLAVLRRGPNRDIRVNTLHAEVPRVPAEAEWKAALFSHTADRAYRRMRQVANNVTTECCGTSRRR